MAQYDRNGTRISAMVLQTNQQFFNIRWFGAGNKPEINQENRIKEDILFMRTKAIDFLKKEKVWEQYKE